MDPICHTLVGGCLARTGLRHHTGLATATLVIAANLPDLDVVAIPLGENLAFRRGWTHGVLALVVLPLLLALLMTAWNRVWPRPGRPPVRFRPLLWLSVIGVLTHPFLDYLNTYGLRWLMPFRDRWYYGDTLFIVDPWMWLLLGAGIWWSLRAERRGGPNPGRPARLAVGAMALYLGAMMLTTVAARSAIRREVGDRRFMAAPVPVIPCRKDVIVDDGERYRGGRFTFGSAPRLRIEWTVPKGADPAAVAAVLAASNGRAFLHWARFPAFSREFSGDTVTVRVRDLRYAGDEARGWAVLSVRTARPDSAGRAPDLR